MASDLALRRSRRTGPLISLVSMIDVMLILLIFFMVTSTYLNLDMIPAVRQQDNSTATSNPERSTLLIRLTSDGIPVINGKTHTLVSLSALLRARERETPGVQILLLPSGAAKTQSLISVMDTATGSGISTLRIIRLEARP